MPKDQAYQLAEQKIAKALKSGATELDLNGSRDSKLTELPDSLWQLPKLTKLNLSDNHLTALPDSLGQLTQLISLNLSDNKLTTLPDSLWKLTQLKKLDLSYNQLTTLQDSLAQLTQLTELNLSNNILPTLPDSLSQLTQLKELDLSNNQLTILPPSLGQLTQLTELDLSNNKLTSQPDWLGQLTQLQSLVISYNKITTLPDSLGQLTLLTSLNLSYNQLTTLPDSLGQLTQLISLNLSDNQLTALPDPLGQLIQLAKIDLSSNQLTTLPDSLGQLTQLKELELSNNQLTVLPNWIGNLINLQILRIPGNKLSELSESINNLKNLIELWVGDDTDGNPIMDIPSFIQNLKNLELLDFSHSNITSAPSWLSELQSLTQLYLDNAKLNDLPPTLTELSKLKYFKIDNNPLNPALQSAYDACSEGKYEPLWAYLRSLEGNAEPLYEAKLVLVGEGGVGKTTLLNALMNKEDRAPKLDEATTHGVKIDVNAVQIPHPAFGKEGVNIQLNAWDFGGQEVYRVTHQFFFSRRSIYLLVWEPRRGVQQCQVEDWLNMIRLRVGDEARVIIVSTNSKSGGHIARIDQPVFKQQYGEMIVGFHEVDSLVSDESTGEMVGIVELKKIIAEESIKFNHVGMLFNNDWKAARDELIARPEAHISYETFTEVCSSHKLSEIDTSTLAVIMNSLGYIVHYSDDEKLRDDVVLKPEWLTKAIGFVLEDRTTAESEGILPDKHLYEVWHNHQFKDEPRYTPELYPFFLRLMEKYDVSYRLPDDRKASLVAQHVPQVRPELPWLPEQEPPKDQRRIAMVCSMEEEPPGLVPWMIVRTHDYAYPVNAHSLHWQKGMFLSHGMHGTAMLEKRGREFLVYTQATYPEYFMNVLQETLLKLIKDNWPGLEGRYRFMVPCPEVIDGQACKGRFNIHALRQFLAEGDSSVRCQECSKKQSIAKLLLGFEERTVDVKLQEINQKLDGIDSRIADYFMATMRAIADEAKNGPRLFTLNSGYAESSIEQLLRHPMELQLWCEAEGCQHPLYDYGLYKIESPKEWVKQTAHYAILAFKLLNIISPAAAPAINTFFGPKTTETWKIADQLSLAGTIIDKLPTKIETPDQRTPQRDMLNKVERSGILALHRFLNEVDPTHEKLGLHRVATYTGDFRWLCKRHYDAYQPNIPDVIPTPNH